MTTENKKLSFFADEPGSFAAEVLLSSEEDAALCLDYAFGGGEGAQLTITRGEENVQLDLAPSDLPRLGEALNRLQQRMAAEQEAIRATADEPTNQPGH